MKWPYTFSREQAVNWCRMMQRQRGGVWLVVHADRRYYICPESIGTPADGGIVYSAPEGLSVPETLSSARSDSVSH